MVGYACLNIFVETGTERQPVVDKPMQVNVVDKPMQVNVVDKPMQVNVVDKPMQVL